MCLKLSSRVYGLYYNLKKNRGSDKCVTPWEKNTASGGCGCDYTNGWMTVEWGLDSEQGHQNLLFHPDPFLGPSSLLLSCYRCLLPAWVKQPEFKANHTSLSTAGVKKERSHTLPQLPISLICDKSTRITTQKFVIFQEKSLKKF